MPWAGELRHYLQAKGLAKLTIRGYLYSVALFLRHGTDLATQADILDWLSWYRESRGQSATVSKFSAIQHYYGWLISEGIRDDNPCDGILLKHPSPPVKDPFTEAELRVILTACRRPQERAVVLLLIDTGLRLREIATLKPDHVDLQRRLLVVRGKGDKERALAFGRRTSEALRPCLNGRGYLWHSQRSHGQMQPDGLYRMLRSLGRRTGIRVHPHRFRTTFAILFDERTKGDTGSLQILLGHTKVSTTLGYIQHGRVQRALDRQREVGLADAL